MTSTELFVIINLPAVMQENIKLVLAQFINKVFVLIYKVDCVNIFYYFHFLNKL